MSYNILEYVLYFYIDKGPVLVKTQKLKMQIPKLYIYLSFIFLLFWR